MIYDWGEGTGSSTTIIFQCPTRVDILQSPIYILLYDLAAAVQLFVLICFTLLQLRYMHTESEAIELNRQPSDTIYNSILY